MDRLLVLRVYVVFVLFYTSSWSVHSLTFRSLCVTLSVSSVLSVRAYTSNSSTGLLFFSQMTQIYRLSRTFSLTTHRDLKVVELTELVDKWTGRQVDELRVKKDRGTEGQVDR